MEVLRGAARRLFSAMDDVLFPERVRCLCCARGLTGEEEDGVCPACAGALLALGEAEAAARRAAPVPGIDYVRAAFPYEAQARTLILRLKFERVRAAAEPLARAMAALPGGEEELLVPVPTTARRLRERGFNQAALLASRLGETLGMPVAEALVRRDDAPAQSLLSAQARAANLSGSMEADGRAAGKRILLIDDVYTTGATAGEAARALRAAGARSVSVFAAARSEFSPETPPHTLFQR